MARKRYISTELSTDGKLADLSIHGFLPLLLYTWSIPHMDDWGRLTGDARQFKLLVCPALDILLREVDEALNQIAAAGLWERYEVDGKWCIAVPATKWFKHQSYINKGKREDDAGSDFPSPDQRRRTPQNAEEHRETPQFTEEQQESPQIAEIRQGTAQIAASFSSSFSLSSSPYSSATTTTESGMSIMDAHTKAFKTFNMSGLMSDYVMKLKSKGCDDNFIIELLLETGESSGNPNIRLMETIGDRWLKDGIHSRAESKAQKDLKKAGEENAKYGRRAEGIRPGSDSATSSSSSITGGQLGWIGKNNVIPLQGVQG